jgi:hypothetical protein
MQLPNSFYKSESCLHIEIHSLLSKDRFDDVMYHSDNDYISLIFRMYTSFKVLSELESSLR